MEDKKLQVLVDNCDSSVALPQMTEGNCVGSPSKLSMAGAADFPRVYQVADLPPHSVCNFLDEELSGYWVSLVQYYLGVQSP